MHSTLHSAPGPAEHRAGLDDRVRALLSAPRQHRQRPRAVRHGHGDGALAAAAGTTVRP